MHWFKFYSEFSHDPKIRTLPTETQLHFVLLLCMKCEGILQNSDEKIIFYLKISKKKWKKSKKILMENGLITQDCDIPKWEGRQFKVTSGLARIYKYRDKREAAGLPRNRYINPSIRKEILIRDQHTCKLCDSNEDLIVDYIIPELRGGTNDKENMRILCRSCSVKKRDHNEPARNETHNTHNAHVTTELDLDLDLYNISTSKLVDSDRPPVESPATTKKSNCPYDEIRNIYHKHCAHTLPQIAIMTDKRKQRVKKLWQDYLPELSDWEKYFELVTKSNFLTGRAFAHGRDPFRCTFDWLINPANCIKVLERNYNN